MNRRLHELANIRVSTYFGAPVPHDEYAELQNEMNPKDFPDWSKWRGREWFRRAQEIADEKRFFHWELEFPESFYEKGAPKDNPGWDAVVGNPPYVRIQRLAHDEIDYIFEHYETPSSKVDISICFLELGSKLIHKSGKASFISTSQWLSTDYGIQARCYFGAGRISKIIDFGSLPVFFEVSTYPAIFIITDRNNKILQYALIASSSQLTLDSIEKIHLKEIDYTSLGGESWILKGELDLRQKFQGTNFSYLEEYGHFYIGALTGMDDVFVVSKEFIEQRNLELDLILPYAYRGEEIYRYEDVLPAAFLIYPYEGCPNEESKLI